MADALEITKSDTVVELGPGRGALTDQLITRAKRVVAIEIDHDLAALLREKYAGDERVTIIDSDVLDVNLGEAAGGPYLVAGNVPYNITTPILFHALRFPRAERAVYLVQREVAERVIAEPASEDYGALSVNLQALAHAELVFRVAAGAFTPPPKVQSAVLRIVPRADQLVGQSEEAAYRMVGGIRFRRRRCGAESGAVGLGRMRQRRFSRGPRLSPPRGLRFLRRLISHGCCGRGRRIETASNRSLVIGRWFFANGQTPIPNDQ
jgi:16S rRNA (adenine1518-N6/adenine1519-N6)-dimethyltransferase